MSEIILSIHIATGVLALISSFSSFFKSLSKLKVAFWPSISIVSFSGLGLIFTGASIVRVCISGVILTLALVLINKKTSRKLATQQINN